MKKPYFTIRAMLLIIVCLLNLLIAILVGKGVYQSWIHYEKAQSLKEATQTINYFYDANKYLSLARAASMSILFTPVDAAGFLQSDLKKAYSDIDTSFHLALASVHKNTDPEILDILKRVENKYQLYQQEKTDVERTLILPVRQRDPAVAEHFYKTSTALIIEIQTFTSAYSRGYRAIDAAIYRQMLFKYFVWSLAEYTGQEYAIIGKLIATDTRPTAEQQEQLLSLRGYIEYSWQIVRRFSENDDLSKKVLPLMEEAHTHYFFTFDQTKELFYSAQSISDTRSYPISSEMWLGMAAQVVDSLLVMQNEILKETQNSVDILQQAAKKEILMSLAIFICAVVLSLYCWAIIVFRVTRPVNAMVNALYKATQENIFEMPKILYQHDEIGKLLRVLEAFQSNARKMKRSNEELERFAYVAAHDLKSPLRAVDNISQWLEEDLGDQLSEKNKKYMDELRRRVRLMDKLLDDTLEYARINAKMESANNPTVNGKIIVDEIIALLELPQEFTVNIADHFSHITLKKFPLQQVLYNLVNNAVKHNDKAAGIIDISVEESVTEYIFYVGDNGPGVDPQYHQKIFEMFQTLQARDKSKGRGMGLAMVRKIVMANGGMISVESEPDKGAIFRFTWPKSEQGA